MPKLTSKTRPHTSIKLTKGKSNIERRLKIPRTPLSAAFSHLKPNWRTYIEYVEIAAKEGDDEMIKLLAAYRSKSLREQRDMTPEYLCDIAGVKPEVLIAAVMPLLWRYSNFHSSVVTALYNPQIIETTAKQALKAANAQDRTTFLKVSGALPTPKGGNINILNAPVGSQGSLVGTAAPLKLKSPGQSVLEAELADADDE